MTNDDITLSADIVTPVVAMTGETLKKVKALTRRARALKIRDAASFSKGDELNGEVRTLMRSIQKARTEVKAPVLQLGRDIDAAVKDVVEPLEQATAALSQRLLAWQREQERLRAEQEAAARKRMEEAKAKAAEAENAEQAEAAHEELMQADEDMLAPKTPQAKPKSVTRRRTKVLVIDDADAIPREIGGVQLLVPDEVAIKRMLVAGAQVPGCRLEEQVSVVSRARG